MRMFLLAALVATAVVLGGCISVRLGTGHSPVNVKIGDMASSHVSRTALRPYDGTFFKLDLLQFEPHGEVIGVELWPIFDLGLGIVGAHLQLGVVDMGAGALWYQPKPPPPPPPKPKPPPPPKPEPAPPPKPEPPPQSAEPQAQPPA